MSLAVSSVKDLVGVRVHVHMQLSPGPARPHAVLLKQLLTRNAQLQAHAVHQ